MSGLVPSFQQYVQEKFHRYSNRGLFELELSDSVSTEDRLSLLQVCKRPEFRPLLNDTKFRIRSDLTTPFCVSEDQVINLSRSITGNKVLLAFYLRHALEIVLLRSCHSQPGSLARQSAIALAAFHTALYYLDGMIFQEQQTVFDNVPEWVKMTFHRLHDCCRNVARETGILEELLSVMDELLRFQNIHLENLQKSEKFEDLSRQTIILLKQLQPLAFPVERILTMNGDNRLRVNKYTGLNDYGCSPKPRPWAITFSSCTASSVSEYGYDEAERLRQELIRNVGGQDSFKGISNELAKIRRDLIEALELDGVSGLEVIFSPSGTDAELYALHFAMHQSERDLLNILISRTEIGSGTVEAAAGRHFDTHTPMGNAIQKGAPIEEFPSERVDVTFLELRHANGELLNTEDQEKLLDKMINDATQQGKHVLLHLLDSSKTGIGGPGLEVIRTLRSRYKPFLDVVVDAAQMRLNRDALRNYLENQFMVIITGSKFFTGPPFSGAILVPSSFTKSISSMEPFPKGYSAYGSKYDLQPSLQRLGETLATNPNFGLAFRWKTFLWELKAFYSVPANDCYETIRRFGESVLRMINDNPDTELVLAPIADRKHQEIEPCWDTLATIFTFLVNRRDDETGERRPLAFDETKFAYRCLNMDIARYLPVTASARENRLASERCHIGQPVRIMCAKDVWIGALRIAVGARLVSGVAYDYLLGATPVERLDTEIETSRVVFRKLSVIVKYWDDLVGYESIDGTTQGPGFYLF